MATSVRAASAVLKKHLRTFKRSEPRSVYLSERDQTWLERGKEVEFVPIGTMIFEHRSRDVVRILGIEPDTFVIRSELDEATAGAL
jgi:hypothetical protein